MSDAGQRLPFVEWGVAARAHPGQEVSGDASLVQPFPGGVLFAVVDGLGHGSEATAAAQLATSILGEDPSAPVLSLIGRCHEALRRTRGAVISLASYREAESSLTWLGIGNVEGTLIRASSNANPPREDVLLRGGVIGYQIPSPRAAVISVSPGDLLVFATDGIRPEFQPDALTGQLPQQCAEWILEEYVRGDDDALVLAARFLAIPA